MEPDALLDDPEGRACAERTFATNDLAAHGIRGRLLASAAPQRRANALTVVKQGQQREVMTHLA